MKPKQPKDDRKKTTKILYQTFDKQTKSLKHRVFHEMSCLFGFPMYHLEKTCAKVFYAKLVKSVHPNFCLGRPLN